MGGGGASKRNGGLFLSRKVKSNVFLIQYLQFLNIENAEPKKKGSQYFQDGIGFLELNRLAELFQRKAF
jgi:hypothetical protein